MLTLSWKSSSSPRSSLPVVGKRDEETIRLLAGAAHACGVIPVTGIFERQFGIFQHPFTCRDGQPALGKGPNPGRRRAAQWHRSSPTVGMGIPHGDIVS